MPIRLRTDPPPDPARAKTIRLRLIGARYELEQAFTEATQDRRGPLAIAIERALWALEAAISAL